MNSQITKIIVFLFLTFFALQIMLYAKPVYVVTGHPLYSILIEVVGQCGDVIRLVPPGASPHSYAPLPSDVKKTQNAMALFYVSNELDGWAAKLPSSKKLSLMDFIPKELRQSFPEGTNDFHNDDKHNHGSGTLDPHFWTDPMTVKAMLPKLVEALSKLDPNNAKSYKSNAQQFENKLVQLNNQIALMLKYSKGKTVFLFHPSFLYFLKRYGLNYGGSIEIDPGVEPSANYAMKLINRIKNSGTKAIYTEPQLPDGPAKTIANSTDTKLYILDPEGGFQNRFKYDEILLYNARIFEQSLK